jgi:hypothetical protein
MDPPSPDYVTTQPDHPAPFDLPPIPAGLCKPLSSRFFPPNLISAASRRPSHPASPAPNFPPPPATQSTKDF